MGLAYLAGASTFSMFCVLAPNIYHPFRYHGGILSGTEKVQSKIFGKTNFLKLMLKHVGLTNRVTCCFQLEVHVPPLSDTSMLCHHTTAVSFKCSHISLSDGLHAVPAQPLCPTPPHTAPTPPPHSPHTTPMPHVTSTTRAGRVARGSLMIARGGPRPGYGGTWKTASSLSRSTFNLNDCSRSI